MTTKPLLVVSVDSIRRAFAEHLAQFNGMSHEQMRQALARTLRQTPGEYADEHAERFYTLLQKHAEATQ